MAAPVLDPVMHAEILCYSMLCNISRVLVIGSSSLPVVQSLEHLGITTVHSSTTFPPPTQQSSNRGYNLIILTQALAPTTETTTNLFADILNQLHSLLAVGGSLALQLRRINPSGDETNETWMDTAHRYARAAERANMELRYVNGLHIFSVAHDTTHDLGLPNTFVDAATASAHIQRVTSSEALRNNDPNVYTAAAAISKRYAQLVDDLGQLAVLPQWSWYQENLEILNEHFGREGRLWAIFRKA